MAAVRERELVEYADPGGRNLFREWLDSLKDLRARVRIDARPLRVRLGNLGDAKAVGDGVHELPVSFGPGYRVYFGVDGPRIVVLRMGGDKSSQRSDNRRPKELWAIYRARCAMANATKAYVDGLNERLRNSEYAAEYLSAAASEGRAEFLLALRDVARAQGMGKVARRAHRGRESLYKALSGKGNPGLDTLLSVLRAAGVELQFKAA